MSESGKNIHKEFELERLILFSDAVFAIAITLLIIDIKFPEIPKDLSNVRVLQLFGHTINQFVSFVISFFFVGLYWAKHLKLCRYMRSYDNGVIFRNLFFLFFAVIFPFTASGVSNMRPNFMFPLFLYFGNILFLAGAHHVLMYYILRSKPGLSVPGEEPQKKYMLAQSLFSLGSILLLVIVTSLSFYLFPNNDNAFPISIAIVVVVMRIGRRSLRKLKPKKVEA